MIFISCTLVDCGFVARIHGPDVAEADHLVGPGSQWYPDRYPCPVCGERCAFSTRTLEHNVSVIDLTPHEAFIAFSGAGLPEDSECSASRVAELLCSERIKSVSTRHIRGTNRCTLDRIVLESGVVLHLGASTHGACVYRVQQPSSYAEEVELSVAAQLGGKSG